MPSLLAGEIMDYFDVQIAGSAAVFKVINDDASEVFVDADGIPVEQPVEPINFVYLSWCINRPAWMEQLPASE